MGYGTRPPRVRANVDPKVMESLGQLRQRMLQQAALDDAAKMDEFFGRVPPKDPNAAVMAALEDPLSDMVGATGAPRRFLEQGQFRRAVDEGMPPAEPLVDMLNRNDRSRTLLESRINRLSPEDRQGSLAGVWMQAQQDAAQAAAAQRAAQSQAAERMASAGRVAMHPMTVAGAATAGVGGYMASRPEPAGPDAIDRGLAAREVDLGPLTAGPGPESEALVLPDLDMSGLDEDLIQASDGMFAEEPEMTLTPDTPDEAMSWSPGPQSPVIDTEEPSLSNPQQRTLNALVTAGIPYSRAMDILLGRASLSPDEYRMVTGGRR
jgi:hypothetical protein